MSNKQRQKRASGLVVDVVTAENGLAVSFMDAQINVENFIKTNLTKFKSDHGISSYEDLKAWIQKDMTSSQRTLFRQFFEVNEKVDPFVDGDDSVRDAASLIGGILAKDTNGAQLMKPFSDTIAMLRITRTYAMGFKIMETEGYETAIASLAAVREAFVTSLANLLSSSTRIGNLLLTSAQFVFFQQKIGKTVEEYLADAKATEPASAKTQALIDVIHQTQVSRLSGSYFEVEAMTLFTIMPSLSGWVVQLSQGSPTLNQDAINAARQVIANKPKRTLVGMQNALNKQDNAEGPVYRGDDLSDGEVINLVLDGR